MKIKNRKEVFASSICDVNNLGYSTEIAKGAKYIKFPLNIRITKIGDDKAGYDGCGQLWPLKTKIAYDNSNLNIDSLMVER